MAYQLKRGEAVGDGVRRVAGEELGAVLRNLRLPPAQRDTGIHEARKSLKKVRALLRWLGPVMGAAARREQQRLRDAARRISGFRDAVVAIETLDGLITRHGGKAASHAETEAGIGTFRASLVEMKKTSETEDAGKALRLASAAITRVESRVQTWNVPAEDGAAIRPGLEKTYRRGRKALKAARGHFGGAPGHDLRKRVKDLWYHVRLLDGVWLRADKLAKRLNELETQLGDLHNLTMLAERLPAVSEGDTKGEWRQLLEKWIASSQAQLSRKAEALSIKLYAEKAGTFVQSILVGDGARQPKPRKAAA